MAVQRPASAAGGLNEEPSFGGSLGGSSTTSVQRSFGGFSIHALQQPQQQPAGPVAWRLAPGSSSAAASSADTTSPLRPVAEEGSDEAESAPPPQSSFDLAAAAAAAAGGGTAHPLGTSALEQLALLQRVVSVAGSLLEAGRVEELYCILSSTISRPLVRPTAGAALRGSSSGSVAAGQPKRPDLRDRVRVLAGPYRGAEAVVRFRGPCHWSTGEVLGLELLTVSDGDGAASSLGGGGAVANTSPVGVRDGLIYFRCDNPSSQSAFVAPAHVSLLG
ncbi:hypothetical protein GPECTOR_16g636 [Gonium pectorale]|uniref:CAP-Gly domain-containing protein n=1 Tax=Gonium pectorale TaxID=33097 RepID=A0A150GKX7_GONPE|nr:hypothetical protein GPECTOR_16g636 [Gonium pectorale]|eukprot:KXZ50462.1 hypothetical protein GPECTOR_16g636 [Gonium pectorale]